MNPLFWGSFLDFQRIIKAYIVINIDLDQYGNHYRVSTFCHITQDNMMIIRNLGSHTSKVKKEKKKKQIGYLSTFLKSPNLV